MTQSIVYKNARIVDPSCDKDEIGTLIVVDGIIKACGAAAQNQGTPEGAEVFDAHGKAILPGLVDARVYVGEPGNEHRETIQSASNSAAAGGVTSFVMMPDTHPVIDDVALVEFVKQTARDNACVHAGWCRLSHHKCRIKADQA